MSISGTYSLRLKKQRQEQLRRRREEQRKEKIRREATKLITDSRKTVGGYVGHMVQQFGQSAQQQAESLARQAERLLQSDPDQALKLARKSCATVECGIVEASRKTAEWTREKVIAQEAVTILKLSLESMLDSSPAANSNDKELLTIAHQLVASQTALRHENFESAKELAVTGQEQVRKIELARYQQQEQEEVRREIVRGLRDVLTGMNFTVQPPCLGEDDEEGKVVMVGSLPSGRTARFVISLAGQVEYDFDGYSHRECGKDSEKIRSQLEEQCQAKATVIKTHWKDEVPNLTPGTTVNSNREQESV